MYVAITDNPLALFFTNFSFDFSENEKVVLENNVISDNIIIKSFRNFKDLPKNGYAIIDDGSLPVGECRRLTEEEIELLKEA